MISICGQRSRIAAATFMPSSRARRGQERRYELTTPNVGQLMRLLGCTIAALSEARDRDTFERAMSDDTVWLASNS